jgi:hypothetical protein
MKALLALLVLAPSFAQAAPLICTSGERGEDNRLEVTIDADAEYPVIISQHELYLRADKADLTKRGHTIAIVERKVEVSAEGEEWAGVVNALLVYQPKEHTLNLTMMLDGFMHVADAPLQCR